MNPTSSLQYALFAHREDNVPKSKTGTWEEFVAYLKAFADNPQTLPSESKDKAGAFSCVTYAEGSKRGNAGVLTVTAAVFDIDHATQASSDALGERLEASGLEFVVYSSNGHKGGDDHCYRVVFPLTEPVDKADWRALRSGLASKFGFQEDDKTKDAARFYYLPSWRGEDAPTPEFHHIKGEAVDPRDYVKAAPKPAPKPEAPPRALELPPDSEDPVDIAAIKKAFRASRSACGDLLRTVADGLPFTKGGRNDSFHRAVCAGANLIPPQTPPDAWFEVFRPTLEAMLRDPETGHDAPTEEMLRKWIHDRKEIREIEVAEFKRFHERREAEHRTAHGSPDEPYTEEQWARWAAEHDTTDEGLQRRLIIDYKGSYFVFYEGDYVGPYGAASLLNVIKTRLSRSKAEITFTDKKGGVRQRELKGVLYDYCTTATDARMEIGRSFSTYDSATDTFLQAVARLRPLEPRFDPQIDKWLRLMSGGQEDKFLSWVATTPLLSRPSCCIYLKTEKSAGKNLLAAGLSRLWTNDGFTAFEDVVSSFNARLKSCPLVYADEGIGNTRYANLSETLKKLITQKAWTVNEKYAAKMPLTGHARFIIGANNDNVLSFDGKMTTADYDAIEERFWLVEADKSTPAYLDTIPNRNDWDAKSLIARHALWLRYNHPLPSEASRCWVSGDKGLFKTILKSRAGKQPLVLEWIAGYLANPKACVDAGRHLVIRDGALHLNPRALKTQANWETYVQSCKVPSLEDIRDALKSLSVSEEGSRQTWINHTNQRTWEIQTGLVLSAAAHLGENLDAIQKTLASGESVPAQK